MVETRRPRALELVPGTLSGATGSVTYPPPFNV
jgi:hypothetical protein